MRHAAFMLAVLTQISSVTGVRIPANNSFIQYSGRIEHNSAGAVFDMTGSSISIRVEGATIVKMLLAQAMGPLTNTADTDEPTRNEFVVYVDGQRMPGAPGSWCAVGPGKCTFDTAQAGNGTIDTYLVAAFAHPQGRNSGAHDIRIVKTTEPAWDSNPNWVTFAGFELDVGRAVPPIVPLPERRIEFIGDSTITGYCNTCDGPMQPKGIMLNNLFVDWTADQYWATAKGGSSGQSYVNAWPHLVCKELGADCHTSAWSGMGLIHDCCADEDDFLPATKLWHRTIGANCSSKWDFARWVPDALVINLGMNDGKRVNTPKWEDAYVKLISNATYEYGKKLQIFLACGPVTGRYCAAVKRVVERTKAQGLNTHFLDQRRFLNGTYGGSCCGHPSHQVGEHMAKAASAEIAARLDWGAKHYESHGFVQSEFGVDGPFSQFECMDTHGEQCDHGLIELISEDHKDLMQKHFMVTPDHALSSLR